jgi:putative transposase
MSQYRRFYVPGGQYFFTVVTANRRSILTNPMILGFLREALIEARRTMPFQIPAMVVLPDHFHAIWSLPRGDDDFSKRMKLIKALVSKSCTQAGIVEAPKSASRVIRGERGFWQRRFWEHLIRDETDFERHFHYIHFNPVKHGYVRHALDWPHSSYHRYVAKGIYQPDWRWQDSEDLEGA